MGGYGTVGKTVSEKLGKRFPGDVIVAGRDLMKARSFSLEQERRVIPMSLDVCSMVYDDPRLSNVKLVVMCIDQPNTFFVEQCFKRAIHYIDITASYDFISSIMSLKSLARSNGATAVLSVGLAPGLTNLLAKQAVSKNIDIKKLNIYIYLGLGEKHGKAAIQWSLDNINDHYSIFKDGKKKWVSSFEDPKYTKFPAAIGIRKTYRANFSDQHVIAQSLKIASVSTRVCFDSAFMTGLYAFLKKTGLSLLFKFKMVQKFLISFLRTFPIGTEDFVIKVEVEESGQVIYDCSVEGTGEAVHTGLVAAKVAEKLISEPLEKGVFHMEQLFEPLDFIWSLNSKSLKFSEQEILSKSRWRKLGE